MASTEDERALRWFSVFWCVAWLVVCPALIIAGIVYLVAA